MKRRDVIKRIAAAGFVLIRAKGKHDIYSNGHVSVSVPRHAEIKEGTAHGILKDAGVL